MVQIDRSRTQQVLINLIKNAIQASPERSEINVHVTFISVCHLKAKLTIEVLDQGPGISPRNLERIFEPHFSKKSGGQGLGLTISRRIAEKLEGTIKCCNLESGGAAFMFS